MEASSMESNRLTSQIKTYANVTFNQEPPTSYNNQINIGILLSKFTCDFLALFNPLLFLLITVLAKLGAQNDK